MLDYVQLGALLAVEETGTYEGAARELNVTSFAIKQRIKTLEAKLGIKVVESNPTRTSRMGRVLCDHTRQVRALEEKVIEEHRQDGLEGARDDNQLHNLSIAVCDEIFTDWFIDTLGELDKMEGRPTIKVAPAPKPEIIELMRSGEVVAAISHHSQEVYGFKTYELGQLVFRAVASPDYMSNHFPDGVTQEALAKATCYRFCGNDDFAYDWVDQVIGKPTKLRIVRYPSSDGSLKACKIGRVWAMHPAYRVDDAIAS